MMKTIITIFAITITCSTLNSCTNFTPAKDNNFVMMRSGDIQLSQDLLDRQKHIDKPSHILNLKRFFSELFSSKKPNTIIPSK